MPRRRAYALQSAGRYRNRLPSRDPARPVDFAVVALLVMAVLFVSRSQQVTLSTSEQPLSAPIAEGASIPPETLPQSAGERTSEAAPILETRESVQALADAGAGAAATKLDRVDAAIVGSERVPLRSCPTPSCPIQDELTLGSAATAGEPVEGFIPASTELGAGFVQDLYLKPDASSAPYLGAGAAGCQRVALIFNIGIGEEPATGILDTLAAEQVPATMFVMGWWAEQRPPILERMVRDGYPIGSHGYGQTELTSLTDEAVREDIRQAALAIEQATGEPPVQLFTPYAAAIDERVRTLVAAEGYLPVGWEVAAADYGPDATEEGVYQRIMSAVHDGAIVELHLDGPASAESTEAALPRIVDELRGSGFRFVTIPELLQPCPP